MGRRSCLGSGTRRTSIGAQDIFQPLSDQSGCFFAVIRIVVGSVRQDHSMVFNRMRLVARLPLASNRRPIRRRW
jgi:hypothetical protein